ncbi:uncharacterized protein EAF02_002300 [Botrytis sinoallii]|uniref:uncharacterized protein n=1 Tax=Botrytis sinoallii TaxID=1463999 RepID=UPI0019029468|nr:uncharacterized protein EAF02_002300 [Botrytis sinoallii]KAF7889885.1 hypothetical protein EAF02_002300 [Botrytis sinoallii]
MSRCPGLQHIPCLSLCYMPQDNTAASEYPSSSAPLLIASPFNSPDNICAQLNGSAPRLKIV